MELYFDGIGSNDDTVFVIRLKVHDCFAEERFRDALLDTITCCRVWQCCTATTVNK
jgi:hypothetical protein